MSIRTLPAPVPKAAGSSPSPSVSGMHPVAASLLSALGLWLAFPGNPPPGWGWLAWVALVPLFLLIRSGRPRLSIYFGAWVGGLAFWLSAIYWVRLTEPETAWVAWLAMATFLSL